MRINNGSGIPSLLLGDLVKPVNRVALRNNALLEAVVIAAVMVVDADCAGAIMVLPDGDRPPSTWILKPDGPHAMAANEATCLRLAAACGLPARRDGAAPGRGMPDRAPSAVRSGITLRSLEGTPGCEPGLIPIDGSCRRRQS